jgi:hypothetical protein
MTSKVDYGIPLEFGGSWDRFSREWCLNGSLATSRENVARALATLARLWPEEVARLGGDRIRGLGVVSPAVEVGLLLSSCEQTEGFAEVLPRMKSRERSAYSELVLVAALRTLGFVPRFAAPIEGRLLDAACEINGSPLYCERRRENREDRPV